jgi:hypothetical protein
MQWVALRVSNAPVRFFKRAGANLVSIVSARGLSFAKDLGKFPWQLIAEEWRVWKW